MTLNQFFIITILVLLGAGLSLTALAQEDTPTEAMATLLNADGDPFGQVTVSTLDEGKTRVAVEIDSAVSGFHGFHVHATGVCDASTERAFSSAGGHLVLSAEPHTHPDHHGDLPPLLVMADGTASAAFVTDRFTVADLLDEDGSAVIFHAGADNYAHIPVDRYDPDADETTLNTGDAGGRAGCGIVQPNFED